MIAVQTAWLKRHYPVQFMAAIMNSVMDYAGKIAMYIQYCRTHDIPVLPPDVNHSGWRFTVGTTRRARPGIRFGMGAVKNVGQNAVLEIMKERENSALPRPVRFCRPRTRAKPSTSAWWKA